MQFTFLTMNSEEYTVPLPLSNDIDQSGSAVLELPKSDLFTDGNMHAINCLSLWCTLESKVVVVNSVVKNIGGFLLSSAGL